MRTDDHFASKLLTAGTLDVAAALGASGGAGDAEPPVTTALGGGDAVNDIPVPVSLFATDGPGGSGVATTEWRLDGGAWREGTTLWSRRRKDTRRTRVLEYRSTDRAGNVEAGQRLSVVVDTTRRAADARPPGVPAAAVARHGRARTSAATAPTCTGCGSTRASRIRLSTDGPAAGMIAVELVAAPLRTRRPSARGSRASRRR